VIPGGLSKPPLSASRPTHRASASIRDKATYKEALDCEAVKAVPIEPSALTVNATNEHTLYRRMPVGCGISSGHTSGHKRRVSRLACSENRRKTRQGDGFLDRRPRPIRPPVTSISCSDPVTPGRERISRGERCHDVQRGDCTRPAAIRNAASCQTASDAARPRSS
jgi:hypothetical protein